MAVRVTVYDEKIAELFGPGGEAYKEGDRLISDIYRASQVTYWQMVGARTGNLYSSMDRYFNRNYTYGLQGAVFAREDYAEFVHEGTIERHPFIYASGGGWLRVRAMPHSWYTSPRSVEKVRGQVAKPWIRVAADQVIARHGGV